MKIGKVLLVLGLLTAFPAALAAQMVRSELRASNGVVVSLAADDFATRYEYTAPDIRLAGGGVALVAKVKDKGETRRTFITGFIIYRGEWRTYQSALLRGGEAVESEFNDRDVMSCSGSRYSRGCTLSEGFNLYPTSQQIETYSSNGVLQIQLRAQAGESVMIAVPVSYFAAVEEAATGVRPQASSPPLGNEPTPAPAAAPAAPAASVPADQSRVVCSTCRN